jgi:hypothetical protein
MAKKKGLNRYEIRGNITAIFLENKKGVKLETLIDTEDLQRLIDLGYHWHLKWAKNVSSYYAQTTVYLGNYQYKAFYLHNLIMNTKPYVFIDHRNHKTMDNRKKNLRICINEQNGKHRSGKNSNNTSGYRNVSNSGGKWIVQLQIEGKNRVLGKFDDVHIAGAYAKEMRKVYYKDFKGEN